MTEGDVFNRAEEFADVDFNDERLEKRFRRTMEPLSKDPQKSIYGSSANQAEAKAVYNLLGNDKLNRRQIISAGWEGQNELPAMDHRESKPFGPDFKNFIRSLTTVNYSILWVKFRASPAVS